MDYTFKSQNKEATLKLGQSLGHILQGGDILCLEGDLGAGKTALAQGIAVGLGLTAAVTSPTFTFIQEYATSLQDNLRLVHMDLYRLQHPEEVEVIGVEDAFQTDTICLIEWPKIAEDYLPEDRLDIHIQGSGEDTRIFTFRFQEESWQERLDRLFSILKDDH
ncbi:tRNA (adenosine(37)-N6)-threonylcarbamoyltransferase complex ATPase subunit type 1 TsaE [Desulfitobacterium metallireducens]|uniref:tRNA threonylcarbamoyladenosine biosynthesis protein TsaE n=1 Tax=Desulfitobacterium metallireducens DSM 15288 TaxID=871968 RepID=W0E6I3_9FIRM|nr:tRNA (adenosine(37)-N6)-threonylcarbamoyltransferase complex ATPase subunit type 1 TsaE [Desulfitobacterium metallireducens]AHF06362.1 YjeE family ATPase [Desulfitobacterium metallireducens DSM 15288]